MDREKESIEDRLAQINREIDAMLMPNHTVENPPNDVVMRFGLSPEEAKTWLEYEPNYTPNRRKVTPLDRKERTDEDVPEPGYRKKSQLKIYQTKLILRHTRVQPCRVFCDMKIHAQI